MHLCWLITRSPPGSPPSPAPIALSQLLSQYHRDLTMIQELRNEHLTQGPAPVRDQEAWPGRLAAWPGCLPGHQDFSGTRLCPLSTPSATSCCCDKKPHERNLGKEGLSGNDGPYL